MTDAELVKKLYEGFNARDIGAVLAALAGDVAWANGMDGGHVHGRDAVRAYWTRQWTSISPRVDPLRISQAKDGATAVEVHQIVHDLNGVLLLDEMVRHVFHIEGGYVQRFDIENAGQLSSIGHKPAAVIAAEAPARTRPSHYPEPFASRMAGRVKRPLGDLFGLTSFGVNLTRLPPGAVSALHHAHSRQDEFVYVLAGTPTLLTGAGETQLSPGMAAGFAASGTPHHLENRTDRDCVILEIGGRASGDEVSYPADDIKAVMGDDGKWQFAHKDDTPY